MRGKRKLENVSMALEHVRITHEMIDDDLYGQLSGDSFHAERMHAERVLAEVRARMRAWR